MSFPTLWIFAGHAYESLATDPLLIKNSLQTAHVIEPHSASHTRTIDEGQITHLICARRRYDLYDFFRGCFGPASCSFSCRKGPKTPPKKSYKSYFRRAQIRCVIWPSSRQSAMNELRTPRKLLTAMTAPGLLTLTYLLLFLALIYVLIC